MHCYIPVPRAKVYMKHLLQVINLRLPREGDRLKGYGYVEFEDRESLIDAMNIPDLVSGSSFLFFYPSSYSWMEMCTISLTLFCLQTKIIRSLLFTNAQILTIYKYRRTTMAHTFLIIISSDLCTKERLIIFASL